MPDQNSYGSELERIYSNRFDADESYRNQTWKILIRHWFQKYVPRAGSVLDLGCGYGQFINNVECSRKFAMDLNPATKSRLSNDVTLLAQDCSATWDLPDNSLDVVFTSNFFEHLFTKADLAKTIAEAMRALKKGGRLIALGPNIKFVQGAYWDFFDHHLALTELSVQEAFETAGFQIEASWDRFLPYTMVNQPQYPGIFLQMYLMLPLAWKWFGKQFLVIAVKR